jgi:hypothetical protein
MESPAASDNVFTHEPLPDPAKYMRLLEVLDDNYSETTKVKCKLTTWPIDNMPPYHAISYTWGDPKSNTLILMNDKTLEVRTNCEFALKQACWYRKGQSFLYRKRQSHLYRETRSEWYTKSRYFWLDALCIDQSNLKEKSKQVAMMGSIYKNASHVLACIGDHADDSLFFFESLYGRAHYLVRPKNVLRWNRSEYDRAGISLRFRMLHRLSSIHRFALALARLAVRTYFTRIWILQELQLAKHLTILCGRHVLSKDDAIRLFNELLKNLQRVVDDDKSRSILFTPHLNFIRHRFLRRHVNNGFPHPVWHGSWLHDLPKPCMATIAMLKQNYASVKKNLFQLLNEVVYQLQCQDPRDKAYGIISLIDWGDVAPLEPDYTQNDLQVAVKFIEAIMKLGEAQELTEPIWKYAILVVKLFNLNIESSGFAEALKARRRPKEDCATEEYEMDTEAEIEAAKKALEGPKIGLECYGWCLSPEDIDQNTSKLRDLEATPPQYPDNDALYLPRWAQADDWVIELEHQTAHDLWYGVSNPRHQLEPTYIPLLVVGRGIEGRRKGRIGYGFYSPLKKFHAPGFKQDDHATVYFYFDIEDSIIFLWKMKQLYEMHLDSKDWMVDFLDTYVSEQHIPGPSVVAIPSEPPERTKRVKPKFRDERFWRSRDTLYRIRNSNFVLFDTKTRRGWFVNGQVVALELLCAYLKNTPQAEPFDLSKLNYIEDKSSRRAYKVLGDVENLKIPISRVLKDVEETPGDGQSFQGQAKVETKLVVEVLRDIYRVLSVLDPLNRFPGDMERFALFQMPGKKSRNVIGKGWDFERIYRTSKAKVYTHSFDKDPGWLDFARDARAGIIFGSDFGEMIVPRDEDCCPYFKILPKGQDYLAIGMDRVQHLVDYWTQMDEKDKVIARLSDWYAWKRGLEPFGHLHGHGKHLEQVDCSCFPVQRLVKVPHYDTPEEDMVILKKRRGELYSSQEVEDMNVTSLAGINKLADDGESRLRANGKLRKRGWVVFGNRPDPGKLQQLAQANESEAQFRDTAEDRRNSHCSEVSVASSLVRSSRLKRASETRWSRLRGKEYPTLPSFSLER